jgi:hypothetical protein
MSLYCYENGYLTRWMTEWICIPDDATKRKQDNLLRDCSQSWTIEVYNSTPRVTTPACLYNTV